MTFGMSNPRHPMLNPDYATAAMLLMVDPGDHVTIRIGVGLFGNGIDPIVKRAGFSAIPSSCIAGTAGVCV
jgi:hypothetical protein